MKGGSCLDIGSQTSKFTNAFALVMSISLCAMLITIYSTSQFILPANSAPLPPLSLDIGGEDARDTVRRGEPNRRLQEEDETQSRREEEAADDALVRKPQQEQQYRNSLADEADRSMRREEDDNEAEKEREASLMVGASSYNDIYSGRRDSYGQQHYRDVGELYDRRYIDRHDRYEREEIDRHRGHGRYSDNHWHDDDDQHRGHRHGDTHRRSVCCTDCGFMDFSCFALCKKQCYSGRTCVKAGEGVYAAFCSSACDPASVAGHSVMPFFGVEGCSDVCSRVTARLCKDRMCVEFGCKERLCEELATLRCG
eukprot:GHVQ01002884.1.p1 GENE.GHVQ01002884.1~~GHVQ01002884.1.p1  ORF type:complete len:311 (+),score=60.04 GHVQ01002884.1:529-1461(+)